MYVYTQELEIIKISVIMSVDAAYQKPLIYNKFLPYAAKLNEESEQLFQDIKHYLSVAVQKSELWPGTIYWTHRLNRYTYRCILL